ncbi:VanZ like family protein [Chitinimonas taiwanensis DSM 18899]|uniref:VanZ like family protein n=2 Tax=Chitinimonas TaxID=240411 RepID=A0A1K2HH73_9NEIS|nr:VanZ like family protein [Chitinimonas taiwanensis DSM 18899]
MEPVGRRDKLRAMPGPLPISYLARASSPSWLGKHFLLAWHAVILVTSLYPFSGWRYTGEPVLAYLGYPLPYYHTLTDNSLNLLAYLPLGYAWALFFRCRWYAPLLALGLGLGLSGSVEFIQQFLPQRIASNLDILYNGAGALCGALLAGLFSKLLIVRNWHVLRQRYFADGAFNDYGLVLLGLWLITQLNPAVPLFGVVVQPQGIPQPWVSPIADALLFLRLLEGLGVTLSFLAVNLLLVSILAHRRHAASGILLLFAVSLLLKALFAGLLLKPSEFLAWVNMNVLLGGVLAWLLLLVLLKLKRRWQALAALVSLMLTQLVEALWPLTATSSHMAALFRWRYGHLRDFNGLTQTLSEVWPWLAAAYLIWRIARDWRRASQPTVLGA